MQDQTTPIIPFRYPDPLEYRDVPGFPGYRVGNDGTVWSMWRKRFKTMGTVWRIIKQWRRGGYFYVGLYRNHKSHKRSVHRLVCQAFQGECPDGSECRHFPDRNTSNCNSNNLSWGTCAQNAADRKIHGTEVPQGGAANNNSKITDTDVIEIRRFLQENRRGGQIAADRYGLSRSQVAKIRLRKRWANVT